MYYLLHGKEFNDLMYITTTPFPVGAIMNKTRLTGATAAENSCLWRCFWVLLLSLVSLIERSGSPP